jgi:hypothetical protein
MNRFRIALLAPILPAVLLASSMSAQKASTEEFGTATLYPQPAGESPSPRYEIRIIDRSGVSRPSFVFFNPARRVTTPGGHGTEHQAGRTFSWTTFEADGPVKVQVVQRNRSFKTVQLRPLRHGLNARTASANTIEFVAVPGQKISVEFDTALGKCYFDSVDCVRDILMVFADPKSAASPVAGFQENEVYRPRPGTYATNATILNISAAVVSTLGDAGGKKAVVFGPGVYDIGYWKVPNNVEHIHLEGGAIVYGALDVLPLGTPPKTDDYLKPYTLTLRPEFKLTGHGVLSGRKIPWHMTKDFGYCLDGCWWGEVTMVQLAVANLTVSDITVADSPQFNFTFANGSDARTTGVMSGFKIVAQWAYNTDGVSAPARGRVENCFIEANDDIVKLANSGASIQNCTLWQLGNGAAFQLGWYGKSVSGITVSDIDVIHSEPWWGPGDNSGLLNYAKAAGSGSRPAEIRDITLRNIRLEGKVLRLVGLTPQAGQRINSIRFTNVNIDSWRHALTSQERTNYLDGINGGSINGIRFEDVTVGGQAVTSANFRTVGRFQSNGEVAGVVFSQGAMR